MNAHRDSAFLGSAALGTLSEIQAAFENAAEPDWDGYDARPADPRAFHHARRLATLLGQDQQPTDASIDPDGEVSLDWDYGADVIVSVSVSPHGRLAFAARVGPSRIRGIEFLGDGVPEQLQTLIRRVIARRK